jgi:hypothetical protein
LYEPTVVEMIKAIEIANELNKIFDFSGLSSTVFTKDQLAGGIANPNSVYGLERQSNYEASDTSADPNIFNLLFVQELNFSNDKFSVKTIINVYKENELINTTSVEGYLDEFAIKQSSRNTPEIFLIVSVESHAIESDDFSFHYDPLTGILTPITNSDFDAIIDSDDDFLPSGMGSRLADTINGSADDDILYGFGGNDKITSGIGNDTIFGGQGADTIILSTGGVDVIGYNSVSEGNDTLVGFDPEDKIDLSQLIYGFSDFSFKQFTNEPQVFEISNVRINSSKSRVSADIIIGPDSSLFNTSEKIREAIITFEFDNSKSTLEFTDSSISLDEDDIPFIVANTDIRIIEPEGGFVPMIFSGKVEKPSISDISSGTKLLQVNFTPKTGFTVDDIQVSMTQAFIGAETIDGTVIEIFPKLPNPVKSNGTEVNQSSTIDGLLVIGMDTDESSAIGDNEMRIYQDLSDDGLLKIRFDTDPSVGKEDIATLLVYGIKNPLDTDNFVLQIF